MSEAKHSLVKAAEAFIEVGGVAILYINTRDFEITKIEQFLDYPGVLFCKVPASGTSLVVDISDINAVLGKDIAN